MHISCERSVIFLVLVTLLVVPVLGATGPWKTEAVAYNVADMRTFVSQVDAHKIGLALDASNRPHIAYYDTDRGAIRYVTRLNDKWSTEVLGPVEVGPSRATSSVSIAISPTGTPGICYGDGNWFGNVMYAEKRGSAWATVKVAAGRRITGSDAKWGNCGRWSSVAFDSLGNPHVVYTDGRSYTTLMYATRNAEGTWEQSPIDTGGVGGNVGFAPQLKLDAAGNPHVCYRAGTHWGSLKYAERAKDDVGIWGPWAISTVDTGAYGVVGDTGYSPTLMVDTAGQPHIVYYDTATQYLMVAHRTATESPFTIMPLGYSLPTTTESSSPSDPRRYISSSMGSDNRCHISYYDPTVGALNHVVFSSTTYGPPVQQTTVETDGAGPHIASVVDQKGSPHLVYYSPVDKTIKYATYGA
jgi:hypothetical protein